jgi:hypothetical protein
VRSISPPGAATARCVRRALYGSSGTATPSTSGPSTARQPPGGLDEALDAAYRAKYGRSSGAVARITADVARASTLRVDPA